MLNRVGKEFDNFYLSTFDAMCGQIEEWDDFQVYFKKLNKLRSKLLEKGRQVFDTKNKQFNTLIHGDIWVNNSMFTYNEKNHPDKMMLVDFQFCCWTSPTIDLHYFFNTSLKEDLRIYHQDELIKCYHDNLVKTLNTLGFQGYIPTLQGFHIEFIENGFHGKLV